MTTSTKEESAVATAALAGNHGFSLISNEKLLQLYTSMVKGRMIEERTRIFFERRNLNGDFYDAIGREAAAAGVAIDLMPEDTVVPSQRDLILNVIKGVPLTSIFKMLFSGAAQPGLADRLNLATNSAMANKMEKNGKISVAFSSDESTSLDIWNDALMSAGVNRLPILFVCQTSLTTGPESLNVQTRAAEISLKAQACGFPSITVDGSDVVAVYRVATEAIAHARKDNGPTLIECRSYRSDGHAEIDPIPKMEAYLSRKGLFSEKLKREVAGAFSKELDAAIEAADAGL
jgi:TPP-dependent pyruvate/acetoin dehydrogenase alpha subunit